jgi:Ni,Fe-hydrogenase I large subunit
MSRTVLGPFNRVEGDLEITLESDQQQVSAAYVNSPLYRGFERMLVGKSAMDALVYTPRICGICSVSQSTATAQALADAMGITATPNGQLCHNLMLATESLTDLLTHFYLFFMPDFARDVYRTETWHADVETRFKAIKGSAAKEMLPARAEFLHLLGILAGKWPHTLSIQPGGTSRPIEAQERIRLLTIVRSFRGFLERTLFGDTLEAFLALTNRQALMDWQHQSSQGDLRHFLSISDALELDRLGRATDRFVSYGNYWNPLTEEYAFKAGFSVQAETYPLSPDAITEEIAFTWMHGETSPIHPADPRAQHAAPDLDQKDAYSWCKSPRFAHQVVEVGAMARWVNQGHPLVLDLLQSEGANVRSRIVSRMLELAYIVPQMEAWIRQLDVKAPFCEHTSCQTDGEGVAMIEAARGSLGHWLKIQGGKITHYQIIAPTTWNFSPRDEQAVPGALEQALVGAPIRQGEKEPISVQHIIRSFDPCMVCTVH